MEEKRHACSICDGAEKMTYTVTRWGEKESYLRQRTFSGSAKVCPECGRKLKE